MNKLNNLPERLVEVEGIEKLKPAKDYLKAYYKTLGEGSIKYLGIRTGFSELDQKTLGLDGLIVLGGIAGQGKTSLALQLATGACELGTPTIFYSLEMPRRAIFTKILSRLAGVEYSKILLKGRPYLDGSWEQNEENIDANGLLSRGEAEKLKEAKERLTKMSSNFYIRTRESGEQEVTLESVEKEIKLVKAEHNVKRVLVFVDHLQVFNIADYRDQTDKESRLIMGFKGISERTEATIILISQKNKAGFTSKGLQTIKGSVDIVYLADVVMFLEGDGEKENKNDDLLIVAEQTKHVDLVIDKNRYNAPCKIELHFVGAYSEFTPAK